MIWTLVSISAVAVQTLIFFLFFKGFVGEQKNKVLSLIGGVLYVVFVVFANLYFGGNGAIIIASFLIFALSFLFDGKWHIKLFASILLIASFAVSDALIILIIILFSEGTFAQAFYETDLNILPFVMQTTSTLTLFVITKIIVKFRKKEHTQLAFKYWLALLTIPVISIVIAFVIFDLSNIAQASGTQLFSLTAMAGLLYINALIFILFEVFLQKKEIENRNNALQSQCDMQTAQYEIVKLEQAERKSFFHDFHCTLNILIHMAENNHTAHMLELIQDLKEMDAMKQDSFHTGNIIIDSVFNSKIRRAENLGIRIIKNKVAVPKNIKIASTDMIILFANSLDNAIEACERIVDGDKYIKIGLQYISRDKRLAYKIENPTDGKLVRGKTRFLTSKTTAETYGLGLENMERTVEKYGGAFNTIHSDDTNVFELSFTICNV